MFNMNTKEIATSKGMFGGIVLIAAGAYMLWKGDGNLGIMAIGNGLGIMGIRDAQ